VTARDAAATRERLLRAAQKRFTVYGFEGTSTRDIADEAGVNVSLISRYFGSKAGLYAEVLAHSSRMFAQALEAHGAETPDLETLLAGWLRGLRSDAWPEYGGEHPLMLLVRRSGSDPGTDELRRGALLSVLAQVERVVAGGGRARTATDRVRAELLMAFLAGLTVLHELVDDELPSAQHPRALRSEVRRVGQAIAEG
jgi:AcrR family transcriptional regulator